MSAHKDVPAGAYAKKVFVITMVVTFVCCAIAYVMVVRDVGASFFDNLFGK